MGDVVDLGGPLRGRAEQPRKAMAATGWKPILPVPASAPAYPTQGPTGETPTASWTYRDASGAILGHLLRFDRPDGSKDFRPLTFCEKRDCPAEQGWRWQSWETPRPLYGLDRLAARPCVPVLVVEGEKAADAAGRLTPDFVVVASPGGANGASKAGWAVLCGRDVTIWPDADVPGHNYALKVAKCLKAMNVDARIVAPPDGVAEGWDAADADAENWTKAQAARLIQSAARTPSDIGGEQIDANASGRRPKASAKLLDYLGDAISLWHDPDRNPYGSISLPHGGFETVALDSKSFEIWIAGIALDRTGEVPGETVLRDTIRTLKAKAIHTGPEYPVWRRIGEADGRIYVDLGDAAWRAVEIDGAGWRVMAQPPVKFLRSSASRALPVPEPSEDDITRVLGPFLNVETEGDMVLLCSFAVASFHPRGPFPILALNGEQGSAKSTVSRMLRAIIDPNVSPIRAAPEHGRDLVVAAENSWAVVFDNLSGVPSWLADALCRISTGSGFSTRELHTNRDETVFIACRPVVLNGIPDLARQPDLADRAIAIGLVAIPEQKRRPEREIWAAFQAALPQILGCLFDGVAASMRNLPHVRLERLPRMADFATTAVAAAPGLGWTGEFFLDAYARNRAAAVVVSLEASPLAEVLQVFADTHTMPEAWSGTATELLDRLNTLAIEATRKAKNWPKSPADLGSQIRRLVPPLRAIGVQITTAREGKSRQRIIHITRIT